ncbi:MAG: glycosyltransferase family 4 protein [Patescibacteria group bacterium]|nr:glycosyltransferase family 4 protein [Patescibacteria group bacterium]
MSLTVCSPQLGLSPESNSGGEVYDREVINRLCDKGVKVFTLLPKNRPYQKHQNLTVTYAPIQPMYPPHIFSVFVLPYLIKTYKKEKFDILRVHNPYFVGPAAAIFKKLYPQVPIVASYLHLESGFNHYIDKSVVKSFDHIICISQNTKQEIIDTLNYPKEKISVAYPGVDDRFQPPPKAKAFRRAGKFTIMFVGGLKARKNPEFLLKVMAKLNRPDIQLIYVGTGPMKNKLIGPNVKVTGYVSEVDKPKLYHQASVVVLPSIKEGFGMTLAEAGASGLPVIGNKHSSIKEIIQDGQTGFLAKPNAVADWVNKLLQLIKSPTLCQKMGEAGQKFIRTNFTWEKNIQTHLKVYENLIS